MVLYSETLDFITSAVVATVAEIDSGSTLRDTCLATEVQKGLTKPTMLHGATLSPWRLGETYAQR